MNVTTAARQLGTTEDTIATLVDLISDDAALWDSTTETITETGMEVLRDQLAADATR